MILKIGQALGGIFDILSDIAVNETGFVRQRSGFAAAWIVGMLVVGAVLFGMPDRAEAACNPDLIELDGDCNPYLCYMHCYWNRGCEEWACIYQDPPLKDQCQCGGYK